MKQSCIKNVKHVYNNHNQSKSCICIRGKCQCHVRVVSGSCQGRVRAVSGPCQGRVRAVSGPCQGRVRGVSGACQGNVKCFVPSDFISISW